MATVQQINEAASKAVSQAMNSNNQAQAQAAQAEELRRQAAQLDSQSMEAQRQASMNAAKAEDARAQAHMQMDKEYGEVYHNANLYISNATKKNTTSKKATLKKSGNLTFRYGESTVESFFISKDASSKSTEVTKALAKLINDIDNIKKSYNKLATHKDTNGDFKEAADDAVKAAKGYHKSLDNVSSRLKSYMLNSCEEFRTAFVSGSLQLKQDINELGSGVSQNL